MTNPTLEEMNAADGSGLDKTSPVAPEKKAGFWRWTFRVVRWSTYLGALITLILVFHKTPPPKVETTPQAAARAEEKVESVEQSAAQGEKPTLRLDQSELNSYLASHLNLAPSAAPAPQGETKSATPAGETESNSEMSAKDIDQMRSNVRDVKVQMEGDIVKAYVVFDVHGKDMTLELAGHLASENGFLRFVPVSGQIGALPLPQSTLNDAVKRLMESPENREKLRLPSDMEDLHVENGELVAKYH